MDFFFFLEQSAKFARHFTSPDALAQVTQEVAPWAQRLVSNAGPKWIGRIVQGVPCGVPERRGGVDVGKCASKGVAACDACGRVTCLNHARIDQFGDAICYVCVAEILGAKGRRPKETTERVSLVDVGWACAVLGVTPDTSSDELKVIYRKLSAKWHPDKHRTPSAKAKATEKFKEVQRAYEILTKYKAEA